MSKQVNYLISTIRDNNVCDGVELEEYLSLMSDIICQFDTDVAIQVMEGLKESYGDLATYQAMAIKVNYGY
tara:strand:- start:596 stop:808 length:213 start_codon:yes stop_codon:yes gene_type:complete